MNRRELRHECAALRKAANDYGGDKIPGNAPSVRSGPFGISVLGVPLDCANPDPTTEPERYIPFATHCPYCGTDIRWKDCSDE